MEQVLWIGGPPGAGKTAVASRVARRHGLRLYSADTRTWAHRDRAIREGNAAAMRWEAMTPRERWETSNPAEMLDMSLHHERGPMVVDDVRGLPTSPLIVAEGSVISPSAVSNLERAVWLIPTPEFQRLQFAERELERGPAQLFLRLAAEIEREAREHGVPIIRVDRSLGVTGAVAAVEELFADALDEGPRAETPLERKALLRESNEAIVAQIRGYYARPWAEGDPDEVMRTFLCECASPSCELSLAAPVGVAARERLFAAAHT